MVLFYITSSPSEFSLATCEKARRTYKRDTLFTESPSVAHFEGTPSERCPLIPTGKPPPPGGVTLRGSTDPGLLEVQKAGSPPHARRDLEEESLCENGKAKRTFVGIAGTTSCSSPNIERGRSLEGCAR